MIRDKHPSVVDFHITLEGYQSRLVEPIQGLDPVAGLVMGLIGGGVPALLGVFAQDHDLTVVDVNAADPGVWNRGNGGGGSVGGDGGDGGLACAVVGATGILLLCPSFDTFFFEHGFLFHFLGLLPGDLVESGTFAGIDAVGIAMLLAQLRGVLLLLCVELIHQLVQSVDQFSELFRAAAVGGLVVGIFCLGGEMFIEILLIGVLAQLHGLELFVQLIFPNHLVLIGQIHTVGFQLALVVEISIACLFVQIGGTGNGTGDEHLDHQDAVIVHVTQFLQGILQNLDVGIQPAVLYLFLLAPDTQGQGGDEILLGDGDAGLMGVLLHQLRVGVLVAFFQNHDLLGSVSVINVPHTVRPGQALLPDLFQLCQDGLDLLTAPGAALDLAVIDLAVCTDTQELVHTTGIPVLGFVEHAVLHGGGIVAVHQPDGRGIQQVAEQGSALGLHILHMGVAGVGTIAALFAGDGGGQIEPVEGGVPGLGTLQTVIRLKMGTCQGIRKLVVVVVFVVQQFRVIVQGDDAGHALQADAAAHIAVLDGNLAADSLELTCHGCALGVHIGLGGGLDLCTVGGDAEHKGVGGVAVEHHLTLGPLQQIIEKAVFAGQGFIQAAEALAGSDKQLFKVVLQTLVGDLPQMGLKIALQELGHIHPVIGPFLAGGQNIADEILHQNGHVVVLVEHTPDHMAYLGQGDHTPGEVHGIHMLRLHLCIGISIGDALDLLQNLGDYLVPLVILLVDLVGCKVRHAQGRIQRLFVVPVEVIQRQLFQLGAEFLVPGLHVLPSLALGTGTPGKPRAVALGGDDPALAVVGLDLVIGLLLLQVGQKLADQQVVYPHGALAQVDKLAL